MSGNVDPAFFERVHVRARALISTGVLPGTTPDAMFSGVGSESVCAPQPIHRYGDGFVFIWPAMRYGTASAYVHDARALSRCVGSPFGLPGGGY